MSSVPPNSELGSQHLPTRLSVSRFVSSLAGTYRAFFLYQQDHKALDDIIQNVVRRFQDTGIKEGELKLGITNLSLVYDDEPIGFKEITIHLSAHLRNLGFKGLIFQPPVQSHNFFQFFHILRREEGADTKLDKLSPFLVDGQRKPIGLIPLTSNIQALKLSDETITQQLLPLVKPKAQGGFGFFEDLSHARLNSFPDLLTWICVHAERFPGPLKLFVRNLADATREGYFPTNRFLKVFPLPDLLRTNLLARVVPSASLPERRITSLGQGFGPKTKKSSKSDWTNRVVSFSDEETAAHLEAPYVAGKESNISCLELAENFLKGSGPHYVFGMQLLLKCLGEKNPVGIQEKALKLGRQMWHQTQNTEDDLLLSMRSSLRAHLCSFSNLSLAIYPLRSMVLESETYEAFKNQLLSLGEAIVPALLKALDTEQERSMRKKLCHLLTCVARVQGIDHLIAEIPKAPTFLLRNILMILGDLRASQIFDTARELLHHPQKIVRSEALRYFCKLGSEPTLHVLTKVLTSLSDLDLKQMALEYLLSKKPPQLLDFLMRLVQEPNASREWKRSLYTAISKLGGEKAKEFLESLHKRDSVLAMFDGEERQEMNFVKNLAEKMK